jgi:glucose/arabinose dehydrogenase
MATVCAPTVCERRHSSAPAFEPDSIFTTWEKSPAVSGMAFYDAQTFPQWRHRLFIGALKDKSLIVLKVDGDNVTEQERILGDRGKRIRDVRVGPDGYLYVLTDESNGELLKVRPAG